MPMDNFIVSARKYRPATFDSVVGQNHITGTLKNAIRNNQLAQAFLFCGPRGVGKTTCARILAKTINCIEPTAEIEACGECQNCRSFLNGASFTIHELDAASNNTVEDIRNLIEQVRIPPQSGKYKIYIIDEVHMLSQQAFNAFLKTLEEPPAYAIFILATTEKHKILPTILSRCQIFDFNRIKVDDMAKHLESIATKEAIAYEYDALHIIAQKADGGLRDALSMFDQISSFSERKITYDSVIQNLNILDYDYYFKLTDAVFSSNTPETLLIFNEILRRGFDGSHFIAGFAVHLRNVLMVKEPRTVGLLEVSEGIQSKYLSQAAQMPTDFLLSALNLANHAEVQFKNSRNQRLQVELALMKMCHIQNALQVHRSAAFQNGNGNGAAQEGQLEKKKLTEAEVDSSVSPSKGTQHTTLGVGSVPSRSENPAPVESPATIEKPQPVPQTLTQSVPYSVISSEDKIAETPVKTSWGAAKLEGLMPEIFNFGNEATSVDEEPTFVEGTEFEPIDPERFLEAWHRMADRYKSESKISVFTILTGNAPRLLANHVIEVSIENPIQQGILNENKFDLVNELRIKLKNYAIDIQVVLIEEPTSRKPYTAAERYQNLVAKNPLLDQVRQAFNLGLD